MSSFSSATNQQRTGPVAEPAPQQKSLDVHGGGSGSGGSSTTTTNINNNNTSANANASTTGSSSSNTNTSNNNNNGDNITTGGRQRTQSGHHAQDQLSKTNLYIRGLQTTTKDQDLHDMCNRFGHISSTKAIMDKATGCCRGYGFVEFVNAKSAEFAVRELTKSGVQAQMAKVTSSYSSHGGGGANGSRANNHQMNHHNNNNGGQNQKSNRNSGFSSSNSSNNNLHHNSGSSQHNHNNSPSSNPSHKNNADPTNLYIANLPPNMSEPELEELLSNYGHIVSTRILRDESNNPRGVGFARMESRDKCEEIIEQLNGRPYKGSAEPLVVKFADGGNKKRHHYNNHQYHHHHNNNHNSNNNNNNGHHNHLSHQNHNKAVNQVDEARWQEDANAKDLTCVQSYEHHHQPQVNMSHSNQPTDLPMMGAIRIQPGYPPSIATGGPYGPPPLGPPTSAPQWMHQAGGQPYVVQQQMTQTGGLSPPNQAAAAAAAAAMHYGHIPHLAAQMQGLQITHTPAHAVGGYLPPQHQWPTLWPHPIPQQSPSPMGRLSTGPPMQQQPGPPQPPMQGQHSSKMTPVQQTPLIHQSQPQRLAGQQQQQQQHQQPHHQQQQQQQVSTTIENKIHVSVPL